MPDECRLGFDRLSCCLESVFDILPVKRGPNSSKVFCESMIQEIKAVCDAEKNTPDIGVADFDVWCIRDSDVETRIIRLLHFRYLLEALESGIYLSSSSILFLACYH